MEYYFKVRLNLIIEERESDSKSVNSKCRKLKLSGNISDILNFRTSHEAAIDGQNWHSYTHLCCIG